MRYLIVLIGLVFIFSCKKDPVEPVDCLGVSGGSAKLDNCETCDEDPQNNCVDCTVYYQFNESQHSPNMASYIFNSVVINSEPIAPEDTVWAFNGDECVGKKAWDTSKCNNEICDIIVMGEDGSVLTNNFCLPGDIPTFKIYDVSENQYYYSILSGSIVNVNNGCIDAPECLGWEYLNFIIVDSLIAITAVPCL